MSVKCGNCKDYHASAAQVRLCYGTRYSAPSMTPENSLYGGLLTVPSLAEAPEEGIWVKDGQFYKTQFSADVRLYAKRLVWEEPDCGGCQNGEYCDPRCEWTFEWVYEGRKPLHFLNREMRATAEQASAFGGLTGTCVFCSRRLTDERSIAVGYGPVCAEREGLPWGEESSVGSARTSS